jgi:hypothetical protein
MSIISAFILAEGIRNMTNESKEELAARSEQVRMKIFDAQIGVHKVWIEVDELNKKLVAAGLTRYVVRCW